jgi:hypothetical protein
MADEHDPVPLTADEELKRLLLGLATRIVHQAIELETLRGYLVNSQQIQIDPVAMAEERERVRYAFRHELEALARGGPEDPWAGIAAVTGKLH